MQSRLTHTALLKKLLIDNYKWTGRLIPGELKILRQLANEEGRKYPDLSENIIREPINVRD